MGTFKFCVISKTVNTKTELEGLDDAIIHARAAIKKAAGSVVEWYGLDTSAVIIENVPLIVSSGSSKHRLERVEFEGKEKSE